MSYDFDSYYDRDVYDDDFEIDGVGFAEPGGGSALRAATRENPRNLPCPTCGWPDSITPIDRARGYHCDSCANAIERGLDINYYEEGDDA
jgi:hypothetical protein